MATQYLCEVCSEVTGIEAPPWRGLYGDVLVAFAPLKLESVCVVAACSLLSLCRRINVSLLECREL